MTSIYDDPRVKELMAKIAELTAQLDQFGAMKHEFDAKYNGVKDQKEEWLKTVNQRMEEFNGEMRIFDRERQRIDQEMYKVKMLKESIQGAINQTLEEARAAEDAQAVEQRWQDMEASWEFAWKDALFRFQKECLRFVVDAFERDLHGCGIFDQMGLGKTLEASASLDVIQHLPEFAQVIESRCPSLDISNALHGRTVLWLCPTSIKESTVRELRKWGRANTIKLQGGPDMRNNIVKIAHEQGLVLVVGYEQLRDRKGEPLTPQLLEHQWPIVVLDEAHKFKNEKSSTFEKVEQICKNAGFVLPMTGTPISNKPLELWSILHMITLKGKYKGKFAQSWQFTNEYCSSWGNKVEFAYGAYDRLIKNIEDMVIRRRKDEVLEDLPDKVREVRFLEMGEAQRDVYNQMRDRFIVWLDEQETEYVAANNALALLNRLRQICTYPAGVKIKHDDGTETVIPVEESTKLDEAMELIDELIDNGEKVLVFSTFNDPLKELQRRIETKYADENIDCALIIGGQNDVTRANKVDRFTEVGSKTKVLLGNIRAMGTGLNLQADCSHAIFLDLWWSPGDNEQAEDRLHRQGQKNAVTIHILQCEDSVDLFVAKKLEDKLNMIEGIIERKELRKAIDDGLI